jgi:hypothetical protein
MRAENTIELSGDDAARMQKLLDVLEDLDDTQEIYHNAPCDRGRRHMNWAVRATGEAELWSSL